MKVALFKHVDIGYEIVADISFESFDCYNNYVRLTEYTEVDFVYLDRGEVVLKEVATLREKKKEIQVAAELQVSNIDRQINELLALPHDSAEL